MQPRVSVPICSLSQETQPFVGSLAFPEMVSLRSDLGVLNQLRFRDPDHFRAGMIHNRLPVWESLLAGFSCSAVDLLQIIITPPLGLITPLFAQSLLISLAIRLFSGLPLGIGSLGRGQGCISAPFGTFHYGRTTIRSDLVSAMMKDI